MVSGSARWEIQGRPPARASAYLLGEPFGHSSPARLLGTTPVAPWGVPVPRRLWTNSQRLRTIKCRAHGGAGLTFFRAPAAIPARYITGERSGTRPGAWKRRTGKTQIFSLGSGQGNFNFDQTEFNADLAAVAALCAKADAALVQGATGGQHSRRLAKRCPHRQPTTRIHSPAAGPTRRARATPAVTEENIVNEHILLRCYCADTFDSRCCDARSTRRAAGTRAPPQNTHDTACAFWMRGDASCRGTAPALRGIASPRSYRRARVRARAIAEDHPSRPRSV